MYSSFMLLYFLEFGIQTRFPSNQYTIHNMNYFIEKSIYLFLKQDGNEILSILIIIALIFILLFRLRLQRWQEHIFLYLFALG